MYVYMYTHVCTHIVIHNYIMSRHIILNRAQPGPRGRARAKPPATVRREHFVEEGRRKSLYGELTAILPTMISQTTSVVTKNTLLAI